MNIVLTVGSLPYQFDRLVETVDHWAGDHPQHKVYMQIGYSNHKPENAAEWFDFAPFRHFQELFAGADFAVSHGSAGPILAARRYGIPLVLVPRQEKFGECYNDHQVETCQALRGESTMHSLVLDIADLQTQLEQAAQKRLDGRSYGPHLLKQKLVATIAGFVESIARD